MLFARLWSLVCKGLHIHSKMNLLKSLLYKTELLITEVNYNFDLLSCYQLLQDASQGHLTIHHGNIMTFDMFDIIQNNVECKEWTNAGKY